MQDASNNRKFEVSIPFSVKEMVDGEEKLFFDCTLDYHNLGYDGIVAIQGAMIQLLETLHDYGMSKVEAMGLTDKLKELNFDKRPQ